MRTPRPVCQILQDAALELRQMHRQVEQPGQLCTSANCPTLQYAFELDELAEGLRRKGHLGSVAALPDLTV